MQAARQVGEAHNAVLTQRKLQQLLTVVIGEQALCLAGLQAALQALGGHAQTRMGRVQQVKLRQFAPAQLGEPEHETAQQRSVVSGAGEPGKLPQQRFCVGQRLRHLNEHCTHLRQTRRSRRILHQASRTRT